MQDGAPCQRARGVLKLFDICALDYYDWHPRILKSNQIDNFPFILKEKLQEVKGCKARSVKGTTTSWAT